LAAIFF